MTPAALIFDVDGTLAETEEAHRRAFNETFAEAGLDWHWSVQDYTFLLRTTGGKERMRAWRETCGSGPGDAEIAALHKRKTARYAEIVAGGGLFLRPGVADLIANARARGIKVAVATTTNRPNVDALCAACWNRPAHEVFDVIAAGDEVRRKKPAPDVFLLALARLNLPAHACIAFEDSRNGLRSAQSAGLRTVVTPSAYTAAEDFSAADWVLPSLEWGRLPVVLTGPMARAA
ncbi:HAD family hydrolase [Seohaeicola saemankumensis]|nr:HAD family hydrolase [Seohaeicola saemankumensis]MCA0871201.1 HAD family hydrolase [Seohaeicola saemankumensis]